MINVKESKLIVELDDKGSALLTNALCSLIADKKDNLCKKVNCEDCKRQGNYLREQDYEKLASEILDIYFEMYKISMNKTDIPSLNQIKRSILPAELIK